MECSSIVVLLLIYVIFFDYFVDTSLALSINLTSSPLVPAVIVFGDSIVDPGNNNVLKTIIKCNFPPYGQDFIQHKATGRFSNGKIPTDLIASGLGVKELLPPYLGVELQPQDLLTGVSFASGATGFDPLTPHLLNVISMSEQLNMFQEYKDKVYGLVGSQVGANIITKSLYVIVVGTDDLANTYFSTPFRKISHDIPSYVNFLVTKASSFIEQLSNLGARRIGYVGLPPIGCVPSQRTLGGGIFRNCVEMRNQAAQLFNSEIKREIDKLKNGKLAGKNIVYIDIYDILLDLILRPYHYGFEESSKGCCGTGKIEVTSLLCNSVSASTCDDVTKYVFWDSYHPTEKAYKIIVDNIFQKYLKILLQ